MKISGIMFESKNYAVGNKEPSWKAVIKQSLNSKVK